MSPLQKPTKKIIHKQDEGLFRKSTGQYVYHDGLNQSSNTFKNK